MTRSLRLIFLSLLMLCAGLSVPARAEVVMSFYSHDFGDRFPHAFIVLKGKLDATDDVVDGNYGFTAVNVSPAILWGSVKGKVESSEPDYIAKSDHQFDVTVDDATYARLIAKVAEWRGREQPNYSLNKGNYVHFRDGAGRDRRAQGHPKEQIFQETQKLSDRSEGIESAAGIGGIHVSIIIGARRPDRRQATG